ncbi:MAG: spondin domain-containing protein [Bdellovibrionales bacterium]|nr:spondin domain-containing protein [Bdellovibrionales bacterium]
MKILFATLSVLLAASVSHATNLSTYKVTVVNLTKGQPLTPAFVAVHAPGYSLYELGTEASAGLQLQAKDGDVSVLKEEASMNPAVKVTTVGSGVIMPGQSDELTFSSQSRRLISISSMLARTNDAFVGIKNVMLPQQKGQKLSMLLRVYDAGAEANTESCAHIPAPPCNSHNANTQDNEGFVTAHPGIQNIGDLEPLRDAFGGIGAKVVIEKL